MKKLQATNIKLMSRKSKIHSDQFEIEVLCDTPRLYRINGAWVGVGGEYVVKGRPPALDRVYPEATKEQYFEIGKNCPALVKITTYATKSDKPDTAAIDGQPGAE